MDSVFTICSFGQISIFYINTSESHNPPIFVKYFTLSVLIAALIYYEIDRWFNKGFDFLRNKDTQLKEKMYSLVKTLNDNIFPNNSFYAFFSLKEFLISFLLSSFVCITIKIYEMCCKE